MIGDRFKICPLFSRRSFVKTSLALLAGGILSPRMAGSGNQSLKGAEARRIPVILDSDIGDDKVEKPGSIQRQSG